MVWLAFFIACHNRAEMTLRSLERLNAAADGVADVDVFLLS